MELCYSSSYHPQCDEQTEVFNRVIQWYFRSFATDKLEDWVKFLAWVEFAHNNSYDEGAKLTPFEAIYGRSPPTIPIYLRGFSKLEAMDHELKIRDELLKFLRVKLSLDQDRMKR